MMIIIIDNACDSRDKVLHHYYGNMILTRAGLKFNFKRFSNSVDPVRDSENNVSSLRSDCDLKGVKSAAYEKTRCADRK